MQTEVQYYVKFKDEQNSVLNLSEAAKRNPDVILTWQRTIGEINWNRNTRK